MGGARGVDRQDVSGVFQLLISSAAEGGAKGSFAVWLPPHCPPQPQQHLCLSSLSLLLLPCMPHPLFLVPAIQSQMAYHSSTQNRKETEATVVKGLAHAPGLERGRPGMKAAISSSVHSDMVATPCLAQGLMGCQGPCSQKGSRALPGDSGAHRVSCCWWFDCHC